MYILAKTIHCLFPLIALMLLIIGAKRKSIYYVISSLWLSLIALIIHHQISGGEILGTYFNYVNAAIYTVNLIILVASFTLVVSHISADRPIFKYLNNFIQVFIAIGSSLVIANLWMNAYFIENRMEGTPIMQVALIKKTDYCNYKYIFYRVDTAGSVSYLCPDHYGLLPNIGHLSISPDFIATQLSIPTKKQMLLLQQKKLI